MSDQCGSDPGGIQHIGEDMAAEIAALRTDVRRKRTLNDALVASLAAAEARVARLTEALRAAWPFVTGWGRGEDIDRVDAMCRAVLAEDTIVPPELMGARITFDPARDVTRTWGDYCKCGTFLMWPTDVCSCGRTTLRDGGDGT